MKFALIALVASTAAIKTKEEGMPMSTSTSSVNALSKNTATTATTNESLFCDPLTQAETDWVFDYYDSKKTGSVTVDQVKAAIGNVDNDYLS